MTDDPMSDTMPPIRPPWRLDALAHLELAEELVHAAGQPEPGSPGDAARQLMLARAGVHQGIAHTLVWAAMLATEGWQWPPSAPWLNRFSTDAGRDITGEYPERRRVDPEVELTVPAPAAPDADVVDVTVPASIFARHRDGSAGWIDLPMPLRGHLGPNATLRMRPDDQSGELLTRVHRRVSYVAGTVTDPDHPLAAGFARVFLHPHG